MPNTINTINTINTTNTINTNKTIKTVNTINTSLTWMDSKDSAWLKSKLLGWFLKILTVLGPLAEGAFILRL